MAFTTVIDPRAMQDIQQTIDYYEEQQPGLGAYPICIFIFVTYFYQAGT